MTLKENHRHQTPPQHHFSFFAPLASLQQKIQSRKSDTPLLNLTQEGAMMNSQSQSFQDIPPDILLRIFTFLDVEGILSFSSSNRYLRELYQNSVLIAYREALLEAGMIDISDASTSPSFTIREKLTLLKDRKSTRLNSSHSGESRMPSSA